MESASFVLALHCHIVDATCLPTLDSTLKSQKPSPEHISGRNGCVLFIVHFRLAGESKTFTGVSSEFNPS